MDPRPPPTPTPRVQRAWEAMLTERERAQLRRWRAWRRLALNVTIGLWLVTIAVVLLA